MSEVQSRPLPPRGRGSGFRGGRGGGQTSRGGGRVSSRTAATNGDSKHDDSTLPTLEDEGEIGELKKQYGSQIEVIKEMFPSWSDVDILFALRETDGDVNVAVTRISEGTISQWDEVSKPKKERTRAKGKNDTFTTTTAESALPSGHRGTRGGRTGPDSGRGRGRATDRGGRGGRGKPTQATTNGTRKENTPLSVPTEESSEWDSSKPTEDAWGPTTTEAAAAPAAAPAPVAVQKPAPAPESAPKTTWASMLRQSTAPKPAPKPKEAPVPAPKPAEPEIEPLPPAEPSEPEPEPEVPAPSEEPVPEPVKEAAPPPPPVAVPIIEVPTVVVPKVALPPSKDQLTETNLEQLADASIPAPTETAASEAADSWDPRAVASANATPLSASQQQHQAQRTPASGFATTAAKATERSATRTPSHGRRILDQLEPVRMPGNRDQVDRAAVQFGAFSLNGPIDDDIDGDREEPETRPQPPEDSPVAHPRTSLPPAQPAPIPDAFPTQKPAPPPQAPTGPAAAAAPAAQASVPIPSQAPQSTQQFGRFSQSVPQEPSGFPSTKPFESFNQPQPGASAAQNQYEGTFQGQGQTSQPTPQQQQPASAFSSAPSEFSSYYTADHQSRPYSTYYQNFTQQQGAQGQQDGLSSQTQRPFGAYSGPQNDTLSQYPQSGSQAPSRFGATTGATADTPATGPAATQAGNQTAQTAAQNTQTQSHGQQPHDYNYNHPYYSSPYYTQYMAYQNYGQGAYGAPYGGKGGYQPSHYGPHGFGSSPAGFGQAALHREGGAAGSLGDYGRAGTAQSSQQGLGSGFGGAHDSFTRGASSFQAQASQTFTSQANQPGAGPSPDELKPFADAKGTSGPSPSLPAAARPGSAANGGPSQSGLPPPQSNPQSGLGGMGGYSYPGHVQQGHGIHGNQSGAGGYGMGAGAGQAHQNTYGVYGNQGFGGSYYGNGPRGWGTNYH